MRADKRGREKGGEDGRTVTKGGNKENKNVNSERGKERLK